MRTENAQEQYRHECEVRHCLKLRARGRDKYDDYMAGVKQRRPVSAAQIHADCADQWQKGNRGEHGDWK